MHQTKPLRARDQLFKIIPTDGKFQIMRIAKRGVDLEQLREGMSLSSASESVRRRVAYPMTTLKDQLQIMSDQGLVKVEGKTVNLTPLGKAVFAATKDILFRGKTPERIEPAYVVERVNNKGLYTRGPLTQLFSGRLAGKSISTLLDLADEHKSTASNWLGREGSKKRSHIPLSNLIRYGLVETENPLHFGPREHRKGRGKARISNTRELYLHKLRSDVFQAINGLDEKVIMNVPKILHGQQKNKKLKSEFRKYLISNGLDKNLVNKFGTHNDVRILWFLTKGIHNTTEIAGITGVDASVVNRVVNRLIENGFVERNRTRLRVTETVPSAKFQPLTAEQKKRGLEEDMEREIFTTDKVMEYLRTMEKLIKQHREEVK